MAWLWVFIIEAWVLDKISIILSKSDIFFIRMILCLLLLICGLEVVLEACLKIWWTLLETRLMRLSRGISVKMMVLVAHDQTDSKKSLDGSSIPDCMFWSMDCN